MHKTINKVKYFVHDLFYRHIVLTNDVEAATMYICYNRITGISYVVVQKLGRQGWVEHTYPKATPKDIELLLTEAHIVVEEDLS